MVNEKGVITTNSWRINKKATDGKWHNIKYSKDAAQFQGAPLAHFQPKELDSRHTSQNLKNSHPILPQRIQLPLQPAQPLPFKRDFEAGARVEKPIFTACSAPNCETAKETKRHTGVGTINPGRNAQKIRI